MKRGRKMPKKILLFIMVYLLLLNGCSPDINTDDIFEFKGTYIGDASAVGSIIRQLPNAEEFTGMELVTKKSLMEWF